MVMMMVLVGILGDDVSSWLVLVEVLSDGVDIA